jgi:putative transposase
MADYHFSQATTWEELLQRHAAWVHDFNSQDHWAHLKRQDGRRSPAEVLDWVKGRVFGDGDLARCFAPILSTRRVDRQGYVRFRNWRLYGERGLVDQPASVWVTEEEVTIQFAEEPLARYGITYQRDHRHFRQVIAKRVFETTYQSPQPPLLELGPDGWLLAIEQPMHRRRRRRRSSPVQAELFGPDEAVAGR